jgi:hypothetical protein
MRILKVLFAVVLFASVFAIADDSTSPTVNASQSKATLYVYRYKQFVGKALSPSVYCDEAELARMENGRYFTVKLDPGKHSFRSNDKQSGVDLDMKTGQSYFMRVEIATGFMKGHGRLILMAGEQAGYELKQLKPLDDNKVLDKAKVSTAEAKFAISASELPKTAPQPATLTPVSEVTTGNPQK